MQRYEHRHERFSNCAWAGRFSWLSVLVFSACLGPVFSLLLLSVRLVPLPSGWVLRSLVLSVSRVFVSLGRRGVGLLVLAGLLVRSVARGRSGSRPVLGLSPSPSPPARASGSGRGST